MASARLAFATVPPRRRLRPAAGRRGRWP
jgi:hypothetical protein